MVQPEASAWTQLGATSVVKQAVAVGIHEEHEGDPWVLPALLLNHCLILNLFSSLELHFLFYTVTHLDYTAFMVILFM